MENQELRKLLSYEKGKLMLEGHDLKELANMYHLSVYEFFTLFEMYLIRNNEKLKGNCIIKEKREVILTPTSIQYPNNVEMLVSGEEYEDMKRKIFDFAYTKCSNLGDQAFDFWGLDCSEEYDLIRKINGSSSKYSCIYKSSRIGWNQKVSSLDIDIEDQEKRFALIRTK